MARLLGREPALHHRDRVGRCHADALVENDPAIDVALFRPFRMRTPLLDLGIRGCFIHGFVSGLGPGAGAPRLRRKSASAVAISGRGKAARGKARTGA